MPVGTALRRGAGRVASALARRAREALRRRRERRTGPNRKKPTESPVKVGAKIGIATSPVSVAAGYGIADRTIEGRRNRRAQDEARAAERTRQRRALEQRRQAAEARIAAVKARESASKASSSSPPKK